MDKASRKWQTDSMLSNVMVGFLAGIGSAAWVYSKMQRQTGGNTQNSMIVAGIAGLGAFLFLITLLQLVFN